MARDDEDQQDSRTALILAAIGGAGGLLWLLLRSRRRGWKGARGREDTPSSVAQRRLVVRTRSGDRVTLDGIEADLATVLTLARDAGSVEFHTTGDARAGWVSKVYYALIDAGVDVWKGAEVGDVRVIHSAITQP